MAEAEKQVTRWDPFRELAYGAFSRSLTLPSDANVDDVDASFKDGVLRIEIQKKPEAREKVVAIKG